MFVGGKNRPYLEDEYERARALRRRGVPIKQIAARLGVSPGTVHRWTTDIVLTPEQATRIARDSEARWKRTYSERARTWSERCRQRRRSYQEDGRARARAGEALHEAGCMLYWAEGSKGRNTLAFGNSDRAMMAFFIRFLRECFSLPSDRFTFSINVYLGNGLAIDDVERHWLETLDLDPGSARKHIVNHFPTSSSGKRRHKLPYGVCTLKVTRSTEIVQHIFGAIQEYAGFEEPAWLG